jgi:hypothetical protein
MALRWFEAGQRRFLRTRGRANCSPDHDFSIFIADAACRGRACSGLLARARARARGVLCGLSVPIIGWQAIWLALTASAGVLSTGYGKA